MDAAKLYTLHIVNVCHQVSKTQYAKNGWVALMVFITCRFSLRWRQNGRDSVSNHQPRDCLLNRFFRRRSKQTSKLRVTGLCVGNSPGAGEFPAQMASYAENVSIWWRHHVLAFMFRDAKRISSIVIKLIDISFLADFKLEMSEMFKI